MLGASIGYFSDPHSLVFSCCLLLSQATPVCNKRAKEYLSAINVPKNT